MAPIIRLEEVVAATGKLSEEERAFLHVGTGRIVMFERDVLDAAESVGSAQAGVETMAREVLRSDDYRELPDRFDIDDYSIMQRFCRTVDDDALRRGLMRSIQGRGASMRISHTAREYGVEESWAAFRNEALRAIAIDWLKREGIAYASE